MWVLTTIDVDKYKVSEKLYFRLIVYFQTQHSRDRDDIYLGRNGSNGNLTEKRPIVLRDEELVGRSICNGRFIFQRRVYRSTRTIVDASVLQWGQINKRKLYNNLLYFYICYCLHLAPTTVQNVRQQLSFRIPSLTKDKMQAASGKLEM